MGNDALSRSIDRRAIGRIGLVACLAPVASAAGCSVSPAASTPSKSLVRVAALKGPTGVGMVYLMAAQQGGTAANDYTFSVTDSPDEVVAKITSRDVDVAAVPTNLGAVLYNKMSRGVQVLAVNTLGVMYLMELGDTVKSMADLKGRTVYATGQGSNPEYVLRFLLQKNGIDPDTDVQLVYKSEHAELDDVRRHRPQGLRDEEPGCGVGLPHGVPELNRASQGRRARRSGAVPAVRRHLEQCRRRGGYVAHEPDLRGGRRDEGRAHRLLPGPVRGEPQVCGRCGP